MSGCSLDEAFPDTATYSGRVARKEERRRAQKCKGPALTFLQSQDDPDPDRPAAKPAPTPAKLNKQEGFESYDDEIPEYTPKKIDTNKSEEISSLVGQQVDDVIGQKSRSTLPRASLIKSTNTKLPANTPSYFGKSVDDDSFADFNSSLTDNPGYQVIPADFIGSFGAVGLEKSAGKATLSTPSLNDAWKPLTPSGERSSFFELLPPPGGMTPKQYDSSFSRQEKEVFLKKLDTLFARLEELESKRNEYAHTEISLFILSGLFLMFGIETARKMI